MAMINSKTPAELAYQSISTAYAPRFPDLPPERAQAIILLREALESGVSLERLETLAAAARLSQGDFRGKLAGFISTRYWEHKKHAHVIRAIAYDPPKPRANLDSADLTP